MSWSWSVLIPKRSKHGAGREGPCVKVMGEQSRCERQVAAAKRLETSLRFRCSPYRYDERRGSPRWGSLVRSPLDNARDRRGGEVPVQAVGGFGEQRSGLPNSVRVWLFWALPSLGRLIQGCCKRSRRTAPSDLRQGSRLGDTGVSQVFRRPFVARMSEPVPALQGATRCGHHARSLAASPVTPRGRNRRVRFTVVSLSIVR